MKRILSMMLTLGLLIGIPATVSAEDVKYYQPNIHVILNNAPLEFDQPPVIVNDRVLVPMRAIFEAFNAAVFYQAEPGFTTEIYAVSNTNVLNMVSEWDEDGNWAVFSLKRDEEEFEQIPTDVSPIILNDRTLVPLRVVSESLGAEVDWDGSSYTVTINGKIPPQWKSDEEIAKMENAGFMEVSEAIKEKLNNGKQKFVPESSNASYDFDGKYWTGHVVSSGKSNLILYYYDGTYTIYERQDDGSLTKIEG